MCARRGLDHLKHHSHWGAPQVDGLHNHCAQGTMESHSTVAAMAPVSQTEDGKTPTTWPTG